MTWYRYMSRTTPGGLDGLLGDAVWCTTSLRIGAKARPEVRMDSSAPHSARVMMFGAPTARAAGLGPAGVGVLGSVRGRRSSPSWMPSNGGPAAPAASAHSTPV